MKITSIRYYAVKLLIAALIFFVPVSVLAYDITDKFSVEGVLTGAYQYQSVDDATGFDDTGRGAVPFQTEISFRPTESNEFSVKFGFAADNALNDGISPFVLAPWAADLEDDVKDINGRDRDYLLTAWYEHTFQFNKEHTLGLTGGIINADDYLDDNAFANDEYAQFMNEALDNGPVLFLPSYDIGGAIQWQMGGFSLSGVAMGIGENDEGNSFNFYGIQLACAIDWSPGKGNYRVIVDATSDEFSNPQGTGLEALRALLFNFDQEIGRFVGIWTRFGWQDDEAAVDYDALYSGGINITGSLWTRDNDNIGFGYVYLKGGNADIDKTQVLEGYYRLVLNEYFAFTADVQYMKDDYRDNPDLNPKGFILGLRAVAEF